MEARPSPLNLMDVSGPFSFMALVAQRRYERSPSWPLDGLRPLGSSGGRSSRWRWSLPQVPAGTNFARPMMASGNVVSRPLLPPSRPSSSNRRAPSLLPCTLSFALPLFSSPGLNSIEDAFAPSASLIYYRPSHRPTTTLSFPWPKRRLLALHPLRSLPLPLLCLLSRILPPRSLLLVIDAHCLTSFRSHAYEGDASCPGFCSSSADPSGRESCLQKRRLIFGTLHREKFRD
jgi:hypothetical protein